MAVGTDSKAVLATCVVVSGAFLGVNNTLVTETVMKAAPVERGVASAAYSFVRFGGGAVAPWLAGKLGEDLNAHVPFWVGAVAVALAAVLLASGRRVPRAHRRRAGARRLRRPRRRGGAGRHGRRRLSGATVTTAYASVVLPTIRAAALRHAPA